CVAFVPGMRLGMVRPSSQERSMIPLIVGFARVASDHRSRRMSGRRRSRVPYSLLGRLTMASAAALSLFFVWQILFPTIVPRGQAFRALLGTAVLLPLGQYWLNLATRLETEPDVLPTSTDSVLYLRAFDDAQPPFAVGP